MSGSDVGTSAMADSNVVCMAAGIVPCIIKLLSSATKLVGSVARLCNFDQFGWVPVAPGSVDSGGIVPKANALAKL